MNNENINIQKQLIGVFDSGVGGFSVLEKVRNATTANILYFGDCLRAPYGNREKEEIIRFIKEILLFLQAKGVTHFVSACNSMSVMTTDLLLQELSITKERYIDTLGAFISNCTLPKGAIVLVIGTKATIESNAYQSALTKKGVIPEAYIFKNLAREIEENITNETYTFNIRESLEYAKKVNATHIVYGCTHYPLIDAVFKHVANDVHWEGVFINPADFVTTEVKEWGVTGSGKTVFETSKMTKPFEMLQRRYVPKKEH